MNNTPETVTQQAGSLAIKTDAMAYPHADRVFPLFGDENLYFAKVLKQLTPKKALDIGTGSGVLGLTLAENGAEVIGTDINPRALAVADDNAKSNGLEAFYKPVSGSVYEGIKTKYPSFRADLIVSNPPFVTLPKDQTFHTAGHGGMDGMQVIRPLLSEAKAWLTQGGNLIFIALSLENKDGSLVEKEAHKYFPNVRAIRIYPDSIPLQEFYSPFKGKSVESTIATLSKEGIKSVGYYLFVCGEGQLPDLTLPTLMPEPFSGNWQGRLKRYEKWQSLVPERLQNTSEKDLAR